MNLSQLPGAPFDVVLDVGGNVGEFAEACAVEWPGCRVISFEPIPGAVGASRKRARGRWAVYEVAISEHHDTALLHFCRNQHSASTMQAPGTARLKHFGIHDSHETVEVETRPLDFYLDLMDLAAKPASVLVKVDVEGHEMHVIRGARRTLHEATTVICEVQQDATIFLGSPSPWMVDREMERHGLEFYGLADAFLSPSGAVLQFDGIWTRAPHPLDGVRRLQA